MQGRVSIFNITSVPPHFSVSLGFIAGDRNDLSEDDELFDINNKHFRVVDVGDISPVTGVRDNVLLEDVDAHGFMPTSGNGPIWTPTENHHLSQLPVSSVPPTTRFAIANRDNRLTDSIIPTEGGMDLIDGGAFA